ncbi:MAG: hypothetical protein ACM3ZF_09755 [Mycobacterium leprae]
MPDRRQAEIALDRARTLLASLPPGQNLDNHFVVDPAKFDFYAMDCYRVLGEDALAELHARRVIDRGTGRDGLPRSPMRTAEALVTLGVVAARAGDVETAVRHGRRALDAARTSQPSLMMRSRELVETLVGRDRTNADVAAYRDLVRTIRVGAPAPR